MSIFIFKFKKIRSTPPSSQKLDEFSPFIPVATVCSSEGIPWHSDYVLFLKWMEAIGLQHYYVIFFPHLFFFAFLKLFETSGTKASSLLTDIFKAISFASKHCFRSILNILMCHNFIVV